jgi:hypothetical protein
MPLIFIALFVAWALLVAVICIWAVKSGRFKLDKSGRTSSDRLSGGGSDSSML